MSRRNAVSALLAIPAVAAAAAEAFPEEVRPSAEARLAELERRNPGRLCVAILDLGSGKRVEHRASERILMCSTFKAIAAGYVLVRVDKKEETLERRIVFSERDVVQGAPATQSRVGEPGMTLAELCEAAVTLSDNTAGNLLLASFGGPAALTEFFRSLGDDVSRLDRVEDALNYHDRADDVRDTTSAAAMLGNLQKLLFSEILSPSSRSRLASWLITNKTGDARLRAGAPRNWLVGDKTGANGDKYGNANDLAVFWPSDRAPILVSAYCEIPGMKANERNAVQAEIGRIASEI